MEVLLETYYALRPIVATALVGWVVYILKSQRAERIKDRDELERQNKERDNINRLNSVAFMLVLRYMLRRYHSEYMLQGSMTYAQYEDWQELFSAYTALGGNSVAVDWNKDVQSLKKTEYATSESIYESLLREGVKAMKKEDGK